MWPGVIQTLLDGELSRAVIGTPELPIYRTFRSAWQESTQNLHAWFEVFQVLDEGEETRGQVKFQRGCCG